MKLTVKRSRFRIKALVLAVALSLGPCTGALSASVTPEANPQSGPESIVQVLSYDGRSVVVIADRIDNELRIPSTYRKELGLPASVPDLSLNGQKYIDAKLYQTDSDEYRLQIDLKYLPLQTMKLSALEKVDPVKPLPQVIPINYDLGLTQDQYGLSFSGYLGSRIHVAGGSLTGSLVRSVRDSNGQSDRLVGVSYDHSLSDSSVLTLGEFATITGPYQYSKRLRGISISSLGLDRPDLNTTTFTTLDGSLASASDVTVFINGTELLNQRVNAGRYSLTNVPVSMGDAVATVIAKDITGQETVKQIPLTQGQRRYKPGVFDYSVSFGKKYDSFGNYSEDSFSAYSRLGLDDQSAANLSVQSDPQSYQMLGSLDLGLGRRLRLTPFYGYVKAAQANDPASYSGGSIQWTEVGSTFIYEATRFSQANGLPETGLQQSESVSAYLSMPKHGFFGVTQAYQKQADGLQSTVQTLTYSFDLSLGQRLALYASKTNDIQSVGLTYSINLDSVRSTSAANQSGPQHTLTQSFALPYSSKSLYGSAAVSEQSGPINQQAFNFDLNKPFEQTQAYANGYSTNSQASVKLGLKGGLLYDYRQMKAYVSNVSTDSELLIENSDPSAVYFVNGQRFEPNGQPYRVLPVTAFRSQRISVDPDSLAPTTELDRFSYNVKPLTEGVSGFELPRPPAGQEIRILQSDGAPFKPGSVAVSSKEEDVIGDESKVFVRFLEGEKVTVYGPGVKPCMFTYTPEGKEFICK